MWKVENGKTDCWGNVTWWRVYRSDDYWNARIVDTSKADAYALATRLMLDGE